MNSQIKIEDIDFSSLEIKLEELCSDYPEAYNLFIQDKEVGYLKVIKNEEDILPWINNTFKYRDIILEYGTPC